ncbi:hypothetical protein GCM10023188_12220 [Pontibacter saemangeumensis]|uniref:Methyltransferase domain-containing protein n=1 Tax=Pontibacter saemangeumensis TaxID=1084525 RepID=A0ABP8LH11_9BACT
MYKSLKKLKRKYGIFNPLQNQLKLDDILSTNFISSLLKDNLYIPFTGWSLRPYCLAYVLNEILINNRKSIIEFGSGISTILIARLAQLNDLDLRLISVEHNLEWQNHIKKILDKEQLDQYVEFASIPLTKSENSLDNLTWYDEENLNKQVKETKFDLVLVDGPPADLGLERFTAMPFLIDKLATSYTIFLDDAHRKDEQQITHLWKKQYDLQFEIHGGTLGVCRKGNHFDSNPVLYSF